MMSKTFLIIGSIGGFLSVALGAFAAHGLKSHLNPELLNTFHTAVTYQFFHSLLLIMIGILLMLKPNAKYFDYAGIAIIIGTLLFSGSLYLLVITGIKTLGIITPIGGTFFLIGWLLMCFQAIKLN